MRDRSERKERQDKTKGRVMVTRRRCLRLCYKLCIDCALMSIHIRQNQNRPNGFITIVSLSKPFKKMLPKYNLPLRHGISPWRIAIWGNATRSDLRAPRLHINLHQVNHHHYHGFYPKKHYPSTYQRFSTLRLPLPWWPSACAWSGSGYHSVEKPRYPCSFGSERVRI